VISSVALIFQSDYLKDTSRGAALNTALWMVTSHCSWHSPKYSDQLPVIRKHNN
jgi:hypothetical protein